MHLRRLVLGVTAVAVFVQWAHLVVSPRGDFALHRAFARHLLEGRSLYENGVNPYTPFWALVWVPVTFLPERLAQPLVFPLGLAALGLLLAAVRRTFTAPVDSFWVAAAAILLASRFVVRDLWDCGPNLAIAALVWLGVLEWQRGHDVRGGVALGLATALKWTPLLVIAAFLWKRQWRLAGASALATALFTLAPAAVTGPRALLADLSTWGGHVVRGVSQGDPSRGVLGPESPIGIALRPSLGSLLVPPLAPRLAGRVIAVVLAGLVAFAAWRLREPAARDDPRVPYQLAAVAVLALLLSPISWRQHAVAALPALFGVALRVKERGAVPGWLWLLLVPWVLFLLVLSRGVAGLPVSEWVHAHGVYALLLLGLFFATLRCEKPLP